MKKYWPVIIVASLLTYITVRCFTVDITHDEAYSFRVMKHFWHVEALCTANTHWLNSLAIRIAILLHLESNWQIRWLSILSAIVFLTVGLLWLRSFDSIPLKIFVIALALCNPFVLDYFVLARGYASALMLEVLALFLFFAAIHKNSRSIALFALLCAALSAIANYSFAYFFVGFAMVHFGHYYKGKILQSLKSKNFYIDLLISLTTLLFVMRAWLFILNCSNDTGAGTRSITEACNSVFEGVFYQRLSLNHMAMLILSGLLLGFIAVTCVYGLFKYSRHKNQVYFHNSLMLTITLFFITINYLFFNAMLPYARSALFLFPLLCINTVYFIVSIRTPMVIYSCMDIVLLFCFFKSLNLTYTLDFKAQQNTRYVFNYLDSIGANHVAMNMETYGVYTNYYQQTDNMKYHFNSDYMGDIKSPIGYDYILLSPAPAALSPVFNNIKTSIVKQFDGNGIVLLKVNNK